MIKAIPALLFSTVTLTSLHSQAAEIAPKLGAFYAQDRIIEVEIFTSQWDNLKNQHPRGGYCVFGFLGEQYDWFNFEEVRVNGVAFHGIGAKKKSFCGSESKTKPSMNIKFDKFNEPQGKIAEDNLGTDALVLNNSIQDPTFVRQCLAFQMMARAGIPAPLCNFAHVRVNNQDMGVYVNLQPMKKGFFKAHYGNSLGNVYEIAGEQFEPWAQERLKASLDSMKKDEDASLADINSIIDAVSDDRGSLEKIERFVDLDQYIRFWAMEIILTHWDGFSQNSNNTYVYFPQNGKMQFLPWGTDQILMRNDDGVARRLYDTNRLSRKLIEFPGMRQRLINTINDQLRNFWNEGDLGARIDRSRDAINRFVPGWDQGRFHGEIDGLKWNIRARREQLQSVLTSNVGEMFGIRLQSTQGDRLCLNTQAMGPDSKVTNVWGCGDHPDQRFDMTIVQGDYVRLRNPASNNCVNLQGDAEGTLVNAWTCDRHPDQTWKVIHNNGNFLFESQRAPGKCLSLGQEADSAQTIIKTCNRNDAGQNWRRF